MLLGRDCQHGYRDCSLHELLADLRSNRVCLFCRHCRQQPIFELLSSHRRHGDPLDNFRVFQIPDRCNLLADLRQDDIQDRPGEADLLGLGIFEWWRRGRLKGVRTKT